ncbi:malonyl-ACP O-methyltransferase BioC [Bacteroides sp. GD17]|jgi:malonyl-CoA O-methyltransferase|uniref:malonyl-ACP O-methyltransferase BioC n=1 Tax=Bacteroides sp. GD17 TaxID=3139826 RepID=UPI0025ED4830|nr:malonyl-ACP O-methyltransferase BioC [uncultured Bacteroides sp.]
MDKQLIAERFAKARGTYTREARVQQQVAEKMMGMLGAAAAVPSFRHIVEFGCGTGSYSRLLLHNLQPETLLLNDLCPEMEECIHELLTPESSGSGLSLSSDSGFDPNLGLEHKRSPLVRFCPGDAEALDFPEATDLITSCSTLQWFNDPAAFFLRCHHALAPDGLFAFSTFGPRNMYEIRQLTGNGLDYLPLEELLALLSPHFDILLAEEEMVPLPFSTPHEVLKHLKQTGVTGTEKKIWTRGRLQTFSEAYVRQFGNAGHNSTEGSVTLTYHPIYVIAKRKH